MQANFKNQVNLKTKSNGPLTAASSPLKNISLSHNFNDLNMTTKTETYKLESDYEKVKTRQEISYEESSLN